jgi:hypothetical protein
MKTNATLLWVLAVFFFVADGVYIFWSLVDPAHGTVEWVGTLAIGLSGVLVAFIAFFIGRSYASQGGELPEDRLDANIDDGDAEQGFFSPWSWWPIMLAASASIVFLGVAIGIWISFIGAGIAVISLVGWIYEYYRGYFAH